MAKMASNILLESLWNEIRQRLVQKDISTWSFVMRPELIPASGYYKKDALSR